MLKDGHKHLSGVEEAVIKNLEACKQLSKITRTSLGPNGMNKMVINHLERLFVTSDTSTIISELEVAHPAANLVVMAAKAQEGEIGDGTNLVVSLAGELLDNAGLLLREGLHTTEIAEGYEKASAKALEVLDGMIIEGTEKLDMRNPEEVTTRIKGSVCSKQYGLEDTLCPLIAKACISVCPENEKNFSVDNVRVSKLPGGGVYDSSVVKGMVIQRGVENSITSVTDAKVAVFAQGVDTATTDTKGTVLIKSAEELENYSKTEESKMEEIIKGIADSGAKVVVSGSAVGEMALHFCTRYGLMVTRIQSKFELRRFCKATGAVALVKLQPPTPDELGFVKSLRLSEIGGTQCLLVEQDESLGQIATVIIRGSTQNMMDDIERAIDDGVNAYRTLTKDSRCVPAGGAAEIEMARQLAEHARKVTGLEQYAIAKFAEALEVVPRTLAENSGHNATDTVGALYAAHAAGQIAAGVDIETGGVKDLSEIGIYDLYSTKHWAIRLAVDAVVTVLRVDQIIMAKPAGGPKPQGPGAMDED